jgi:hypothetical protein
MDGSGGMAVGVILFVVLGAGWLGIAGLGLVGLVIDITRLRRENISALSSRTKRWLTGLFFVIPFLILMISAIWP